MCLARLLWREEGLLSPDPTLESLLDGEAPEIGGGGGREKLNYNLELCILWSSNYNIHLQKAV